MSSRLTVPKPVETGKEAASTAKKATTRATKKTTGARS
jgi:hypothetical protein